MQENFRSSQVKESHSEMAAVSVSNAVYNWDFSAVFEMYKEEINVVHFQEVLQTESKYEKKHPGSLDEEGKYFLLACFLAETDPVQARQYFYKAWKKEANANSSFIIDVLQAKPSVSHKAYLLMLEILQYGPNINWGAAIAYDSNIDAIVEHSLLTLDSLDSNTAHQYSQEYPSIAMFKVIEALVKMKEQKWEDVQISTLLLQAYQSGIPDKYKYFIVNYFEEQLCTLPLQRIKLSEKMKEIEKEAEEKSWFTKTSYDEESSCTTREKCDYLYNLLREGARPFVQEYYLKLWYERFMLILSYKLFPTIARQQTCMDMLSDEQELYGQIALGKDDGILERVQEEIVKKCHAIKERKEQEEQRKIEAERSEESARVGCILGIVIFIILAIVILSWICSLADSY